jgi:hypothetical protein
VRTGSQMKPLQSHQKVPHHTVKSLKWLLVTRLSSAEDSTQATWHISRSVENLFSPLNPRPWHCSLLSQVIINVNQTSTSPRQLCHITLTGWVTTNSLFDSGPNPRSHTWACSACQLSSRSKLWRYPDEDPATQKAVVRRIVTGGQIRKQVRIRVRCCGLWHTGSVSRRTAVQGQP